jgi:hypothetical protein
MACLETVSFTCSTYWKYFLTNFPAVEVCFLCATDDQYANLSEVQRECRYQWIYLKTFWCDFLFKTTNFTLFRTRNFIFTSLCAWNLMPKRYLILSKQKCFHYKSDITSQYQTHATHNNTRFFNSLYKLYIQSSHYAFYVADTVHILTVSTSTSICT